MTKLEELRTAYEAARDSDSTGECRQYEDEFLAAAFHAMPALLEAVEFVAQVSRYLKDGEADDFGEEFDMSCYDAVETLNSTISDARQILEKLK